MSEIVLYCAEPPELKLGPGVTPQECIRFEKGFARFDEADFPEWRAWVDHPGTPTIEILDADSAMVPADTTNAFPCPNCPKVFASKKALNGHLMSHAPRK